MSRAAPRARSSAVARYGPARPDRFIGPLDGGRPIDRAASEMLVRAVWLHEPVPDPAPAALRAGLGLARRNEVDGAFIRAHSDRLPGALAALDASVAAYRRNLGTACSLLAVAGLEPVLIKASPWDDLTYSNFDLVVRDDEWDAAVAALRPWVVRVSTYPLERRTKLLLHPASGPAVHLHRDVAWFDIPAVSTRAIRARAERRDGSACLLPHPVDAFRITLAHAVFQNQALTLGELLAIRGELRPAAVAEGRRLAAAEGWRRGYELAVDAALTATARLDRADPVPLPVPLPVIGSLAAGLEHVSHLVRAGRPATALRELALRPALVAAKQRRLHLA